VPPGGRPAPEEEALLLLAAERTMLGSDANPITDVGMITWNERIDSVTNPTKEGISHNHWRWKGECSSMGNGRGWRRGCYRLSLTNDWPSYHFWFVY